MATMTDDFNWLIWDGTCGFCRASVEWVMARDRRNLFRPVPFQQAPSPPMTPALFARCKDAVQVVRPDGTILEAGRAATFVLRELGYRKTAALLGARWFRPFTEWGYRRVANNRDFFGRLMFGKACRIEPL